MKLKIKIKEVKEERRLLTIEEQCMYSISNNKSYSGNLVRAAKQKLDEMNLGDVLETDGLTALGIFRTETIRDATDNEIRAWYCAGCIKNSYHVACTVFSDEIEANTLLLNKEVVLELVDE